ncbi:hypothetical protein, partial [Aeromonas allosaccharophila]
MTPMSLQVEIHPIIELSSAATNGMTDINRKTKKLATLCFSLYLIRLGFRAFGYDLLYHNPNDPYGISDLIEVALALIYLVSLGLCILHALWVLLQKRDRGALAASALL